MTLILPVAKSPIRGELSLPGDKSLAHRVALFGALAEGVTEVSNYPDSGVTRSMRGALASLGVGSTLNDGTLTIRGNGFKAFPIAGARAYCGNSATTIRLLAGAMAGTGSNGVLDGSEGLRKRPMNRIVDPLVMFGANVSATGGCAPLTFSKSAGLSGIRYDLPVASAQVKSCLVLAALGAAGETVLREPGPSRDHTELMLRSMGADIETPEPLVVRVRPLAKPLAPLHGTLPGDISSAAFLFVAAAIVKGSSIKVKNVGLNPTRTGILDVLSMMGARICISNEHLEFGERVGDVILESAPLKAVSIKGDLVVRSIDEFPAIAACAAFAEGTTVVREAKELRFKESDRITAIVTQLRALGTEVEEFDDGFAIVGGTLKGGTAQANGDHRLAMSMALCGLRAPVCVDGAEILNESFPDFEKDIRKLLGL